MSGQRQGCRQWANYQSVSVVGAVRLPERAAVTVGVYADVLDFAQRHSKCDINETDARGNRDSQMII